MKQAISQPSNFAASMMPAFWIAHRKGLYIGASVWCAIAIGKALGHSLLGPIEVLFLLAPLVLVPLGFHVAQRIGGELTPPGRAAYALLTAAAVAAAASCWLPKGATAASLASAWLVVCGFAALDGLWRLIRSGYRSVEGLSISASFLYLVVGSVWFVLSRLGVRPMQLPEQTVLLAALHFHFTGFVLPVVAAATARALRLRDPSAPFRFGTAILPVLVIGIFCGPALLATGNILAVPPLKLLGALVLAAASLGLVAVMLTVLPQISPPPARVLLGISAVSLAIAMTLVGIYTVGEFTGQYWLVLPQMARFHGTINALGFALCGLLGWALVRDLEDV